MSSPAVQPNPPLREPARKDPALLHAHAAMRSMLEHGLAPTPANYLVWYSFHSDGTPGLRRAMEIYLAAASAEGRGVAQEGMEHLHAQFFAVEREARSLQEVATRLEKAVDEAVALVQGAREDALRYGGTLDQASSRLAAEPEALASLLRRLISETKEVSRRSEVAARYLSETSRKTVELQAELIEARQLASTDPLTGLANRRQFDEALRDMLAARKPLALALMDIDHFKAVNDGHGHPAGDQVLRSLAEILTDCAGAGALVARFGGEEFAVMLPSGNLRESFGAADRIRARIGHSSVEIRQTGQRIAVTASFGLAVVTPGELPSQLIERADAALYEAKRCGRNRVCCDPPLPKSETVWN